MVGIETQSYLDVSRDMRAFTCDMLDDGRSRGRLRKTPDRVREELPKT